MTPLRTFLLRLSASVSLAFFGFAQLASAQTPTTNPFAPGGSGHCDITNLGVFIGCAISFIDNLVVPIVFAVAFIVFIIGVYRYFIAGGASEEKRQEGQQLVLWGIIGFVIMFSVWGLVNLIGGTLGLNSSTKPTLPTFNGSGSPTTQTPTTLPAANTNNSNAAGATTQTQTTDSSGNTIVNVQPNL